MELVNLISGYGPVDLCLLSLLVLRSHFLFEAKSCIWYGRFCIFPSFYAATLTTRESRNPGADCARVP